MIRLTNQSAESQTYQAVTIQPAEYYDIPSGFEDAFRNDDKLRYHIQSRIISVSDGYDDTAGAEGLAILDRYKKSDVVTLYEKPDKIPRYACVASEYDQNGECTLMIQVPGVLSATPTRYLSLAYFVSDVFGWGDKVTSIEITDEDNLLGMGNGAVLDALYDADVPTINQGWYFYPSEGGAGELEFTPSDKFGEINGQLYIKAKLKRAAGSAATKVFVNIDWGAKRS